MKRSPRFAGCTAILALAITLGPVGCKKSPAVDDASLATALQNRLAADSALSSEPIQITVQNAVATLNGSVSNDAARSLAGNDAAQVTGIRTVVNNLTVNPANASKRRMVAAPAAPAKAPHAVEMTHPEIIQQPEPAPVTREQPPPPPQQTQIQPAQPPQPPPPPGAPVVPTVCTPLASLLVA